MFAAFLLPFPCRGQAAPYLWVFYKLLSTSNERLFFLLSPDYLSDPARWAAERRWEVAEAKAAEHGYAVPHPDAFAAHRCSLVPPQLFPRLLSESNGNPLEVFRRTLAERDAGLEDWLEQSLRQCLAEEGRLEGVLTWCNCPSLSEVARRLDIPVVHQEIGPLREPFFRPTAYVDFSGVNGNTEAEARYHRLPADFLSPPKGIVAGLFRAVRDPSEAGPADAAASAGAVGRQGPLGITLQVEDDSNVLAFSNGYTNQALLAHCRVEAAGKERPLVRRHPGSVFRPCPAWADVDLSVTSLQFIRRCGQIVTINSSLGLEAILCGIQVKVLGECSYRFIAECTDAAERERRLAFYLLAYLVPWRFALDLGYVRFRLQRPTELEIMLRHIEGHGLLSESPIERPGSYASLMVLLENECPIWERKRRSAHDVVWQVPSSEADQIRGQFAELLAEAKEDLGRLAASLGERDQDIARLGASLADVEQQNERLAAVVAADVREKDALATAIASLEVGVEDLTAELRAAKAAYRAIVNSGSWRMTAPLRAVKSGVKSFTTPRRPPQ